LVTDLLPSGAFVLNAGYFGCELFFSAESFHGETEESLVFLVQARECRVRFFSLIVVRRWWLRHAREQRGNCFERAEVISDKARDCMVELIASRVGLTTAFAAPQPSSAAIIVVPFTVPCSCLRVEFFSADTPSDAGGEEAAFGAAVREPLVALLAQECLCLLKCFSANERLDVDLDVEWCWTEYFLSVCLFAVRAFVFFVTAFVCIDPP